MSDQAKKEKVEKVVVSLEEREKRRLESLRKYHTFVKEEVEKGLKIDKDKPVKDLRKQSIKNWRESRTKI